MFLFSRREQEDGCQVVADLCTMEREREKAVTVPRKENPRQVMRQ